MRILFLVPYPKAQAPSQRFRFEQYFDALNIKNYEYKIQSFLDDQTWNILYKSGHSLAKGFGIIKGFFRRFAILFSLSKYDFIFIHREAAPIGPPIFEWVISKVFNKRIIYDFDDAIWLSDPSESRLLAILKWKKKIGQICKWSYKISCGNAYLANFAKEYNDNVVVNPTTIDTLNVHQPELYPHAKSDKLTIGWTGTHSTLFYLKSFIPIIKNIERDYNLEFLVIANRKPEFELSSLRFIPWNAQTEIKDLLQIDIGIMPLTDDQWSVGKCGFKALQFMALGIPCLASPVGVNKQIIKNDVNGILCETDEDWEKGLRLLIKDASKRKSLGTKGRETVKEEYSVDSNTTNFLGLFD